MCVDVDYGRRGSHGGVGKGWARLGLARVRREGRGGAE